ncbi:hypothetical protein [Numidum massiliense]|uniref:hypothetical protein n=1 Tax=Numidum massiliense TaxID=1522315 RepID=UPI0006D52FAA|nr:hypothetical protein [Numidum massiliense]
MGRWSNYRGLIWFVGVAAIVAALFFLPKIVWLLSPERGLNVAIVDKTVPERGQERHKGFAWVLNNEKFVQRETGKPYDGESDYYGYHPKSNGDYKIKELPQVFDEQDLIYLADAYGVYADEQRDGTKSGKRSALIYGGLERREAAAIAEAAANGTTVVAEFNSFGNPTEQTAKETMYNLLGVKWSGWIGRYYDELARGGKVPAWVVDKYEAQTGEKWAYQGKGALFVSERDDIVVLTARDLAEGDIKLRFTEKGRDAFGLDEEVRYHGWFDVVEPLDTDDTDGTGAEKEEEKEKEKEVLAEYVIDTKESGKQKLRQHGLPTTAPAVVRGTHTYYFAGDFAGGENVPEVHAYTGITTVKKWLAASDEVGQEAFYWKVYVPMMQAILAETHEARTVAAHDHAGATAKETTKTFQIKKVDGLSLAGTVGKEKLQVYKNGKWEELLIKGVNMGIAKPGHFPGEMAITKEEYLRWFKQIGAMNANAVRVYTLHPPEFYEALKAYNEQAAAPLYLFHGVWVDEEPLLAAKDAYADNVVKQVDQAIQETIDVVHGKADLPVRKGYASGKYTADVSPYVLGWILGIEWDPDVVQATIKKHRGMADFQGKYFRAHGAHPFESWVAARMEAAAAYETERYRWQRPISFTNWVTTDLLEHPYEPHDKEDLVSVDPHVIAPTKRHLAGQFASYHVYPYYPDNLNVDPAYTNFVDKEGEKNNYAGYLRDLHRAHRMPILVAEFGVPSSRGITHKSVHGMDQGGLTEKEQGEMVAKQFRTIVQEGLAGGLIFSWQDEWFKRTWNTMDYDNADRRPLWSNKQTSEQHYGLLSFDPGTDKLKIRLDGKADDWEEQSLEPLHEKKSRPLAALGDGADDMRTLERLYATSDEAYLYLRLDYRSLKGYDPKKSHTLRLFDTIPGQGSNELPFQTNLKTDSGVDFILHLNGTKESRLLVHSHYDSFYYHYGEELKMIPRQRAATDKHSDAFNPIRLAISRKLYIAPENRFIPFQAVETGKLQHGNGDPQAASFHSLSDFIISEKNDIVEIRLPWALLNVKDPSRGEIMGDFWQKGIGASQKTGGFKIAAVTYKPTKDGKAKDLERIVNVTDSLPAIDGDTLPLRTAKPYKWPAWEAPSSHERLKQSYAIVQREFAKH